MLKIRKKLKYVDSSVGEQGLKILIVVSSIPLWAPFAGVKTSGRHRERGREVQDLVFPLHFDLAT